MPLEKQSLNNFLPDGFETLNQEGYKTNFSEDKIKTGYEKDIKDRVSGPNLNNLIDVVGKNTNTLNNYVEYLNGMPINNVPTVNVNGQLDYMNLDDKLTKKQLTNCILEIPQRIKYILENGTLTIKAGSVLIVPYGVEDLTAQYPVGSTFGNDEFKVVDTQFEDGKFFVWVEVLNDKSSYGGLGEQNPYFVYYDFSETYSADFEALALNRCQSGTETPSSTSGTILWYDTNSNLVKITGEGVYAGRFTCLPVCTVIGNTSISPENYTSVEQVFNGMGYIGSTIWVDKGVKGLIPNGRNEDGTLRNIEYTTNRLALGVTDASTEFSSLIIVVRNNNTLNRCFGFMFKEGLIKNRPTGTANYNFYYFATDENIIYFKAGATSEWVVDNCFTALTYEHNLSSPFNINTLNAKQTFRAIDYNDKSEISGWGMPSKKVSLTLGASGTNYTAPANGWFYLTNNSGGGNPLTLGNSTIGFQVSVPNGVSGHVPAVIIPAKKGDIVNAAYTTPSGSTTSIGFIYAEGEV